jgi:M6 family metalloprotease-like protein
MYQIPREIMKKGSSGFLCLQNCWLLFVLLLVAVCPVTAVAFQSTPALMPPHPNLLQQLRTQGYDSATVVNLSDLKALSARQKALGVDRQTQISAPMIGSRPALVLLVDFQDRVHDPNKSTPSKYTDLLFSAGTYAGVEPSIGSMRDYFRAVSFGNFDLSPTGGDTAWRKVSHNHNYYANADGATGTADDYGFGSYPQNAQGLAVEAVNLANPYVNFASFAVDGVVQGLFIIHAGRGGETGAGVDCIWSHSWELGSNAQTVDGVQVNKYTMEPEYNWLPGDSTIGVFCHEYGHALGLPNLYDNDGTSAGLGNWSLMAGGSWNGCNGSAPAWPDAWSRTYLGWTTVITPTANITEVTIPAAEVEPTVYKLMSSSMGTTEYFLVENRQQLAGSADYCLPSSGLLIYHIDESQTSDDSEWYPGHTSYGHYLVALEQADGLWEMEKNSSSGDPGDPWPGNMNNRTFNETTTPNSKSYADAQTEISVESISDSGLSMTAILRMQGTPIPPSNLTAVPYSGTRIDLAWTDNSGNETGFRIERKTGTDGTFAEVTTVGTDVTSYSDTGLTSGVHYYYQVCAVNDYGDSNYSNVADTTTLTIPNAPSGLTATAISDTQINLSWTDNANNESSFRVEQKIGAAGDWVEVASTGANVTSLTRSSLVANTSYYFRVRAYNGAGYSAYCPEAATTTYALPTPTGLSSTPLSPTEIALSWTDNLTGEAGYRIERRTGFSGTWGEIATVGANVTIFRDDGLSAVTAYSYRIRGYNASGYSAYSSITSSTTYALPAPDFLSATPVTSTRIDLAWSDASPNETGFKIERKSGAGSWQEIATSPANSISYADTSCSAATAYTYRLRAYNGNGYSAYSNEATATTYALVAPTNLVASPISSSQIILSWTDNSNNESGFKIEYKSASEGSWGELVTVGAGITSYQQTGLAPGSAFIYRVRAYNASGYSTYSNEATAATFALPTPANLAAILIAGNEVDLTWTDTATTETGYLIERKSGAGSWTEIAAAGANSTSYQDLTMAPSMTHLYRVRSYNAIGYSNYSNEASATTPAVPAGPSNLLAIPVSLTQINLTWSDNSNNEMGFVIERAPGGTGSWTVLATVGASVISYSNTGLPSNTSYSYRLHAYNVKGDSIYSNIATTTTLTTVIAPTTLTVSARSATEVVLNWRDNSTNETGFYIERMQTSQGIWNVIGSVGANVKTYTDTATAGSTNYSYRVRAYCGLSVSPYSNMVTLTTPIYIVPPTGLQATAVSGTQIYLSWTDNANNEAGYKIERRLGGTSTWTIVATTVANATSYTNSGLVAGNCYYYRVRAVSGTVYSSYSAEAVAITFGAPKAPASLVAKVFSSAMVNLTWKDTANSEWGFYLERRIGTTGTWEVIATVAANATGYSDTTIAPSTSYSYRLRAFNDYGASAYSNIVTITTPIYIAAPTDLTAAVISATQINLSWTDNADNETGYKIERRLSTATTWTVIKTTLANVTGFTNTSLVSGRTYVYRVRAYRSTAYSGYSNEATATAGTP